jgi:hypothetical protein
LKRQVKVNGPLKVSGPIVKGAVPKKDRGKLYGVFCKNVDDKAGEIYAGKNKENSRRQGMLF